MTADAIRQCITDYSKLVDLVENYIKWRGGYDSGFYANGWYQVESIALIGANTLHVVVRLHCTCECGCATGEIDSNVFEFSIYDLTGDRSVVLARIQDEVKERAQKAFDKVMSWAAK